MDTLNQEKLIRQWFELWLEVDTADVRTIDNIFSSDIVYTECYGPQYVGTEQLKRWFIEWNQQGRVLCWDIRRITGQNNVSAVEWFFRCEYQGTVSDFDGVTIACYDADGKICRLS